MIAVAIETTQPQRRLLAGIAPFANCPQQAEALQGLVGADPDEVEWVALPPVAGQEAAQGPADLDLTIRGECIDDETLVVTMELPGRHGPPEVIELPAVTIQMSVLDLERAASLARALAAYLLDKHRDAAESFAVLAQRSSLPAEQADLTFLQATSLLFDGHYEEALQTYDTLSSDERLGAWAGLNAGVATTSRFFQILMDQHDADADMDEAIQAAVVRLKEVAQTTATEAQIKAKALTNLAITEYMYGSGDSQEAVDMCTLAIDLEPDNASTHLCRAAAMIQILWDGGKGACAGATRFEDIARDLTAAARLVPEIPQTWFWQGDFLYFQAEYCDSDLDRLVHLQQAQEHFARFVKSASERPVTLAMDQYLIENAESFLR